MEGEGFVYENLDKEEPGVEANSFRIFLWLKDDLVYDLKTKSLMIAVDILFKIQIVLKIEFASECAHIWACFKQYFYRLEQNGTTNYINVQNFVKANLLQRLNELHDQLDVEEEDAEENGAEIDDEEMNVDD